MNILQRALRGISKFLHELIQAGALQVASMAAAFAALCNASQVTGAHHQKSLLSLLAGLFQGPLAKMCFCWRENEGSMRAGQQLYACRGA
ncbi:hypothetical protein WJX84_005076 [Apatococcus fuscideae]|uniref:Uncharacterized protein n=1 Tax=Apatococcus fuscideae TaxID=2026836 RepID=A0AAW1SWF6_9CHLO